MLGWPAEDVRYVYEQYVLCPSDGIAGWYGTPGPPQTTVPPSPIDQETLSGTAIAVALTPPAVAVARKLCHAAGSIQSQELRFTTLNNDGLRLTTGDGNVRESAAFNASAFGVTTAAAARAGETLGNHERAPL